MRVIIYTAPIREQTNPKKRLDPTVFQNHMWLQSSGLLLATTLLITLKTSLTTISSLRSVRYDRYDCFPDHTSPPIPVFTSPLFNLVKMR